MPRCPTHPEAELEPKKKGWYCEDCDRAVIGYDQHPRDAAPSAAIAPAHAADAQLDAIPFPVAYPLAFARDMTLSAADRVTNLVFTAYQAMRTTALVLLADYLACDTVCRELAGPVRGLRLPHWNEWSTLADKLCLFWQGGLADRPSRQSFMPALVDGWSQVDLVGQGATLEPRWQALLAGLGGLGGGPAKSANDAIQKLRNDRAHRMEPKPPDTGVDDAALERFGPLVEEVVRTLFPPGGFTLWRRVPGEGPLQALRLHGAHVDLCFEAEPLASSWEGAFVDSSVIAIAGTHSLALFPLLAPPAGDASPLPGGGLSEPVMLVDGIKEKVIVQLGVRSFCEATDLIAATHARFRSKDVDLALSAAETTAWTIGDWARATARENVATLHGRKYFPECYVERQGVDDTVAQLIERPGKALLLLGEAGAGKSSLLARLVDLRTAEDLAPAQFPKTQQREIEKRGLSLEQQLADRGQGDVIVFVSGRADFAGDSAKGGAQLLVDAVLRKAGVREGEFDTLEKLAQRLADSAKKDRKQGRRVVLVLDALNEADRYVDLVKALDAFLPCLGSYPWLRVVVSMRSGAYQALSRRGETPQQLGGVFANERFFTEHFDARASAARPYLELRPFRLEPEGRAAYEKRRSALPERSSTTPWTGLSVAQRELLLAPLHLHLFHEAFCGCEAPATLTSERRLFAAYLDHLMADVPGLAVTLRRAAEWMYAERRPDLSLAEANAWVSQWRAASGFQSAACVVKLDPIEELVAATVLMRPAEEGWGAARPLMAYQFAHQQLCEQVLLRELRRRISPRKVPSGEELVAWTRHAASSDRDPGDGFVELLGALEVVSMGVAEAGAGEVLGALLDVEEAGARARVLGAAVCALGPAWGPSEQGGPTAQKALRELLQAAESSGQRSERFGASVCEAQQWLEQAGFSRTAGAISRARLAVMRRLVAAEPHRADLLRDLSVSLNNMGNLAEAAGDSAGARAYFEESLAVRRKLVAAEPHRADLRVDLAITYWDLFNLATSLAEEVEFLVAVLATLRPLRDAGAQHAQLEQLWGLATQALEKRKPGRAGSG